jgi:RNA polymerase sigma factor for flagellar operon FliA
MSALTNLAACEAAPDSSVQEGTPRPSSPPRLTLIPGSSATPRRRGALAPQSRRTAKTATPRRSIQPGPRLDAALSRELLERYTPLVRKIAGGFQRKLPRNVLREDLLAAGMGGLWDAIRRHGQTAGDSFEWYVRVRVRGAILDELRAQDWLPRRARAAAANASAESGEYVPPPAVVRLDDVSEWEQSRCLSQLCSSESAVAAKFTQENLARAVDKLPERERHIVSAHYFRGVKFKDLGVELGVSEPRISQLHSRAMQRLKLLVAAV